MLKFPHEVFFRVTRKPALSDWQQSFDTCNYDHVQQQQVKLIGLVGAVEDQDIGV